MTMIFLKLYPLVALIALIGYLPQLRALFKAEQVDGNISLATWVIWTLTWLISMGYGTLHLQDLMFCITAGINLVAHFMIIGLIVYKRYPACFVFRRL